MYQQQKGGGIIRTSILVVAAIFLIGIAIPGIVEAQTDSGTVTTEIGTIIVDVGPMTVPTTNTVGLGDARVPPVDAIGHSYFRAYTTGSSFNYDLRVHGTNSGGNSGYMKTDTSGKTLGSPMSVTATDNYGSPYYSQTLTLTGNDQRIFNDRPDTGDSGRRVDITLTQHLNQWTDPATSSSDRYWITVTWTIGTNF